jgi:hypothetical protein
VSTLEDVSFVSAEESVADLRDFDELRQEENSFQKHKFIKETKEFRSYNRIISVSQRLSYVQVPDPRIRASF